MREELYKVKCPRHIVMGDPLYFEEYTGKRLQELIVDYKPPQFFEAGVVLREEPDEKYPEIIMRTMSIYLAPKETLRTYMSGMMYESQKSQEKAIGVDTACYVVNVDGRSDVIHTGGDGYWGNMQLLYRMQEKEKLVDAVILNMGIPEFNSFKDMQQWTKYFFEDVKQIKEKEPKDKAPER